MSRRKLAYDAPGAGSVGMGAPRRNWKKIVKTFFACVLVALLAFGGWTAYQLAKTYGTNNPFSLFGAFIPSSLDETNGRTNILLAGYSADDKGHGGATLTDSIMILSIDSKHKKADMISVPRDLYVNVPGEGYSKINAAYQEGEADHFNENGYAKGGMGLLEKTVERATGVHSNYYALINYTAFKDTVDAVGGVSINIKSEDSRGLYDPNTNLKLSNGTVQLDGQQALNLARSRGDGYGSYGFVQGDFDRTQHQQELLQALKEKAGSPGVIANPFKVGSLAQAAGDNIKTDLSVGQIETLYFKTKGISSADIKSHTLNDYDGTNLLTSYNVRGQSALIPRQGIDDYSEIKSKIDKTISVSNQN